MKIRRWIVGILRYMMDGQCTQFFGNCDNRQKYSKVLVIYEWSLVGVTTGTMMACNGVWFVWSSLWCGMLWPPPSSVAFTKQKLCLSARQKFVEILFRTISLDNCSNAKLFAVVDTK